MRGRAADEFEEAASFLADVVSRIRDEQWNRPGLGEWDVRALVGHAGRALTTLVQYSSQPAEGEEIPSAVDYLLRVPSGDQAAIAERGWKAGVELGDDPAGRIREMVASALEVVRAKEADALIAVIGGTGMRFEEYLQTRTFELVVHAIDLARAIDAPVAPPSGALASATALATRAAVRGGRGVDLLLALTGRSPHGPISIF